MSWSQQTLVVPRNAPELQHQSPLTSHVRWPGSPSAQPTAQLCKSTVSPFREGSVHEQLSGFAETSEKQGKYYLEIMSRKSGTNFLCSTRMQPAEHLFSMQNRASPYTGTLHWVSHNNLRVKCSELSQKMLGATSFQAHSKADSLVLPFHHIPKISLVWSKALFLFLGKNQFKHFIVSCKLYNFLSAKEQFISLFRLHLILLLLFLFLFFHCCYYLYHVIFIPFLLSLQ